uniref:Uncharacterized protein n=1 Tax=Anguilla anguilla TaxID=7936 RepID=A0A0E9VXE8_ANGAN
MSTSRVRFDGNRRKIRPIIHTFLRLSCNSFLE